MAVSKLEKIIELINEMNKKGMPLNQIRNNLKQLGLDEKQVDVLIAKADIHPTNTEIQQAVTSIDQKISSGEHIRPLEKELKRNTEDTSETRKQVEKLKDDFESHKKRLDEIHRLVQGISSGDSAPAGSTQALENKIDELTDLIKELKPVLKSIDSTVNKMLEINKKVLLKK